jgi:hypothetical protein
MSRSVISSREAMSVLVTMATFFARGSRRGMPRCGGRRAHLLGGGHEEADRVDVAEHLLDEVVQALPEERARLVDAGVSTITSCRPGG